MKFNWKRFVGVLLFWVGVIIIANSFVPNVTGFAIQSGMWKVGWGLFGLLVGVGGIIIFRGKKEIESFDENE